MTIAAFRRGKCKVGSLFLFVPFMLSSVLCELVLDMLSEQYIRLYASCRISSKGKVSRCGVIIHLLSTNRCDSSQTTHLLASGH